MKIRDNILVSAIANTDFEKLKTIRRPATALQMPGVLSVTCYPPRDEVQSRFRLQIDVAADDADDAAQLAKQLADRLAVSLSLVVPGGRYHVELLKLRVAKAQEQVTAWSDSVGFIIYEEPEELTHGDIKRFSTLFETIEKDLTAENAYAHLLSAWALEMTSGAKPLQRSILQHYALCIEAVVNGAMKSIKLGLFDKIRGDEKKYAAEFCDSLVRRADKPKAIREAASKLSEISLGHTIPAIELTGKEFGVSEAIVKEGQELYRFRSRKLSHPGRPDILKLDGWLKKGPEVWKICRADAVARAFMVGYCESRSK